MFLQKKWWNEALTKDEETHIFSVIQATAQLEKLEVFSKFTWENPVHALFSDKRKVQ